MLTALASQNIRKIVYLLTADDLMYVEISLAPKLEPQQTVTKSVRLKSDDGSPIWKKRRRGACSNYRIKENLQKLENNFADYGEEGLVKGKITDTSFFSAG